MARAIVILGAFAGLVSVGGLVLMGPARPVEKPVAPWIQAIEEGTVITLSPEPESESRLEPKLMTPTSVADETSLVPPPPAAVLPQQPPAFPRQTANR